MRFHSPALFIQLVKFGAGRYAKPEEVFAFAAKHKDISGLSESRRNPRSPISPHCLFQLPHRSFRSAFEERRTYPYWCALQRTASKTKRRKTSTPTQKNRAHYPNRETRSLDGMPLSPLPEGRHALHFKVHPEMAGTEYAAGAFHKHLIGHGTPEVELFKAIWQTRKTVRPARLTDHSRREPPPYP